MAHTKVTKTYSQNTGTANTFSYSGSFETFKGTEVVALLDNVKLTYTASTINESASPREYTVDTSAKTIHIGGANLSSGTIIIRPETDMGAPTPRADYTPGASITSADLNNNQLQLMRKAMEYDEQKLASTGDTMTGDLTMGEDTNIVFEGATDDAYETTLTVTDPTADRTITIPNVTGTVVTTGDTATVTATMMGANSVDSSELVDGSIDTSHIGNAQVTTDKLAADAVTGAKLADDAVNSEHYTDGSIDTAHIADLQVTTAKIAADAITGAKIADDALDSEHYTDGSIDHAHLANDAVDGDNIADDSINSEHYVDGSIDTAHIADDQVTAAKLAHTAVTAGSYTAADITVDAQGRLTSASSGTIATSEIAADAITGAKIADDAVDSEHLAADSIDSEHYAAASVDTTALASNAVTTAKVTDSNITTAKIADDAITIAKVGCEQTTISDSDSHIPTSGAVVDYVAAQLAPIGGLEVIADDESFPNTIPSAGVVISITDAAGLQVNSSGVSTNADTLDNSTVTINGFPSELRGGVGSNADPYVFQSGAGLMVQSTGSSQTYNYHQAMIRESDFVQLSDDINDFNSRYRIHAGEPSSNNDDGDLVWDTNANKMKVYDASASAWSEVTSTGDFKFLVPVDAGTTTAATWDGSDTSFDLKETSNTGSAASVSNVNQLLISLNGVIQKPNTGSYSASEEGFYLTDADTIRFCTAPPSGSSVFILQIGSAVSIPTPGDGTVSAAKIASGAVTTAKIADANVTTAKIADDAVTAAKIGPLAGDVFFDNGTNAGKDILWDESDDSLEFSDDTKAVFGTGGDASIYHNGSHTFITNGTGSLISQGDSIVLRSAGQENYLVGTANGSVDLYYDSSKKFETTTNGITVTGRIDAAADSTHDIGTSSVRFANGYFDTVYGDGSNLTGISSGITSSAQLNTIGGTNAGAALDGDTTDNTLFGYDTGKAINSGDDNSAFGGKALQATTSGGANTAVGYYSLYTNTTSEHNTAVGVNSLRTNDGGDGNVAVGHGALYSNTTANENIAIGKNAMYANTEGHSNTAIGYNALDANTTGDKHTAVGKLALSAVTTVDEHTAVGYYALAGNTSGERNTALGVEAGITNTTGSDQVFIGYKAGNTNNGHQNIFIGGSAALNMDTGEYNVAIGCSALTCASSGTTHPDNNVAIGGGAMYKAETANENVAVGVNALYDITTASECTGVGRYALQNVTTGGRNTGIGYNSLSATNSGQHNTALGYEAGGTISSGDYNVCLGYQAGVNRVTTEDNFLFVARNSDGDGNAGCWIHGDPNGACVQGNNSSSWDTSSDQRLKKNIENSTRGLAEIDQIRVTNFEYRKASEIDISQFPKVDNAEQVALGKGNEGVHTGVIAQEIESILPECVIETHKGTKKVNNDPIMWALVNAVKELSAKVKALEAK